MTVVADPSKGSSARQTDRLRNEPLTRYRDAARIPATESHPSSTVRGGPSGLWLACELALARVRVAVLEKLAEPTGLSKAMGLQSRSMEMLEYRGILNSHENPHDSLRYQTLSDGVEDQLREIVQIEFLLKISAVCLDGVGADIE